MVCVCAAIGGNSDDLLQIQGLENEDMEEIHLKLGRFNQQYFDDEN